MLVKGKRKSVLELQSALERYSAEGIRELSALHIGMQVTTQDIDEMLIGDAQAAAIPIVKKYLQGKGQENPLSILLFTERQYLKRIK